MPQWPKDKLLKHEPELPMAERVRRYQENIKTIRASGCEVPTSAMIDTLDPAETELWFADSALTLDWLSKLVVKIGDLPPATELPNPFLPLGKRTRPD
jgi:hypothetical protein